MDSHTPFADTRYDRGRYDNAAITFHWLTAGLVIIQFLLGELWGFVDKPVRHVMIVMHTSLGTILVAVIALRLVWRLLPGHRVRPAVTGWSEIASKTVHWALYALLVLQAGLGLTLGLRDDHAMSFFGLPVPSPFTPLPQSVHHQIGDIHNWVGWAIIILALGHASAALFHHYALKDRVLVRMLPGNTA